MNEQANDWQPINTIPRGGLMVLISVPSKPTPSVHIASFKDDTNTTQDPAYYIYGLGTCSVLDKDTMNYWLPTHWRPLPAGLPAEELAAA